MQRSKCGKEKGSKRGSGVTKKTKAPIPDEPHGAAYQFSNFVPLPPDEFDVEPFDSWGGFGDVEYQEVEPELDCDDDGGGATGYEETPSSMSSAMETDDDSVPLSPSVDSMRRKGRSKSGSKSTKKGSTKRPEIGSGKSAFALLSKSSEDSFYRDLEKKQKQKMYATRVSLDVYDEFDSV
jgi:hypothetical protein